MTLTLARMAQRKPGELLRSVHEEALARSARGGASSPSSYTTCSSLTGGWSPSDDRGRTSSGSSSAGSSASAALSEVSARSRAVTERANDILSGESPRSVRRREQSPLTPRGTATAGTPRRRRMTADQLIQHLGMSTSISSGGGGGDGSGGTRARVPPQWDRLTREQRSLWVAEHSTQSSSTGGTTMSASAVQQQHRTPAEQSIVLALVPSVLGGTAASTFSGSPHQRAFAEGVPPLSRLAVFLGRSGLAHLAPDFAELKYVTPQDLIDAEDGELLGVLYRLRHRMAAPERRRFIRSVAVAKQEAGVATGLSLASIQELSAGGSVLPGLQTRWTELRADGMLETPVRLLALPGLPCLPCLSAALVCLRACARACACDVTSARLDHSSQPELRSWLRVIPVGCCVRGCSVRC